MATEVSENGSQPTAMEKFGIGGGMAVLPWTKQMLTVLWEQLRLLVQVIYYTFMSGMNVFLLLFLKLFFKCVTHVTCFLHISATSALLYGSCELTVKNVYHFTIYALKIND